MPDDDRTRRRLGDETKSRIADLASGWTVEPGQEPPAAPAAEAAPPNGPRKKPRTVPPPPPGSTARKALEEAIIETKGGEVVRVTAAESKPNAIAPPKAKPKEERAKTASKPTTSPPAPKAARKPTTVPPPIPKRQTSPPPIPPIPTGNKSSQPGLTGERTPPVIIDSSIGTPNPDPSNPNLAVPIGEFDTSVPTIDEEKLRVAYAQATIVRDPAAALLKIPEQPKTVVKPTSIEMLLSETAASMRGDPTTVESSTNRFERGDATNIEPPSGFGHAPAGTLRTSAALRRKRGLVGDVFYVFTALFGVRATRRELSDLEHRQQLRQTSRRRHLITLGRTAVTADAFDHPALGHAREELQTVEDERSRHAGAVAAADGELDRVRRDRDAKAKQYIVDIAARTAELADLDKRLEPLEKDAAAVKRRSAELRDSLQRIAKQITETEARLVSVKADKMDRAGIHADIATLKADRKAIQGDEPKIAAELDALNPRIAAIDAARTEALTKKADHEKAEREDQRRTAELLEAIGAKRKVVERAATEAEAARDRVLFELGDRLYVDRPAILGAQMAPIDQIDLELGECDRRIMELREILSNVDKAKVVRGAAVIVIAVAIAGTMLGWLLYMLL